MITSTKQMFFSLDFSNPGRYYPNLSKKEKSTWLFWSVDDMVDDQLMKTSLGSWKTFLRSW